MTFKFHGLTQEGFDQWVAKAKAEGQPLNRDSYLQLAQPSERHPVTHFASVEDGLYDRVLNMCVQEGAICMHHMMAIDAAGGEAYMKAVGMNLPQDVCTAEDAEREVALLGQGAVSGALSTTGAQTQQ